MVSRGVFHLGWNNPVQEAPWHNEGSEMLEKPPRWLRAGVGDVSRGVELGLLLLEKMQEELYYCHYLHLPKGEVTGKMVHASQKGVVIRGNRHKFDLGYTWQGRKSNPKPSTIAWGNMGIPIRFRWGSTSARNSSSIVLTLKLGVRLWLFLVLLFP